MDQLKQRDAEISLQEKDIDRAIVVKTQVIRELNQAQTKYAEFKKDNDEKIATWRVNAEIKMQSYHQEKKMND